jgi:hypothetical protein
VVLIVAGILALLVLLATLYELRHRQAERQQIEDKKAIVRIIHHWFSR